MNQSGYSSQGYVDLHTHSTHSDGKDSPAKVASRAKEAGLVGFALTDHDTYKGVDEARTEAAKLGLRFLPGVEMSTVYKGKEVHVLGYFPNEPTGGFLELMEEMAVRRIARMKRMISKLVDLGCRITFDEVSAYSDGGTIGRAHLFRAIKEIFEGGFDQRADKWLNIGGAAFEPTSDMEPSDAVSWIRKAGGVPVLAHPGTSGIDDVLSELIAQGMMGIEAVYPKHSPSQVKRYKKIAREAGVLITGGSDWHGLFQGVLLYHSGSVGASRVHVSVMDEIIETANRLVRM